MHPSREPRWWPLLLVLPAVFGLLVIVSRLAVGAPWHQILQIGVVFGVALVVERWARRGALRCCEDQ